MTKAHQAYTRAYPGESPRRQPVHTVYGGAQLFKAETARKMGQVALAALHEYAPDAMELAWCLDLPRHQDFAKRVYERVVTKLEREAVEDFRIDFEDGYGHRPDAEEDGHAVGAAEQVAKGLAGGTLPPFIGIRIKSLSEELFERAARTLELYVAQVSLAGTGVALSDGATNVMPVGPHKRDDASTLTMEQKKENREVVHRAWRLAYEHTRRSLALGYYQGWDLHPAQLPVRYAAVYAFFLEGMDAASRRLKSFIEKAAQATLLGDVFDDAATGQGLLNSFLRGISCGAITEEEAQATGLSLEELRSRSFLKILEGRRSAGATPGEGR